MQSLQVEQLLMPCKPKNGAVDGIKAFASVPVVFGIFIFVSLFLFPAALTATVTHSASPSSKEQNSLL